MTSNHGVQRQQLASHSRVREVYEVRLQRFRDAAREGLHIDFQPQGVQRHIRADVLHDLMHPENVGPKLLVAEGVESEDLASVVRVGADRADRRLKRRG